MARAKSPGRKKSRPQPGRGGSATPGAKNRGRRTRRPERDGKGETQGVSEFRSARFVLGAAVLQQAPPDMGAEVAFGGRSNAGKSSALNVLTGQSSLARVSKTPGRTQQINFFDLGAEVRLVDLPGYGFARAPASAKAAWAQLVESYLQRRRSLKGMVVIMDCRRPMMESDQRMVTWANEVALPFHVVLTKADKLSRNQASRSLSVAQRQLETVSTPGLFSVQLFSAPRREGVTQLGEVLKDWLWHE